MSYKNLTKLGLILHLINLSEAFAQDKSNTEKMGDMLQILIPATGYAATFSLNDVKGRNQFYKFLATNLGVTYTLKYTVNKPPT